MLASQGDDLDAGGCDAPGAARLLRAGGRGHGCDGHVGLHRPRPALLRLAAAGLLLGLGLAGGEAEAGGCWVAELRSVGCSGPSVVLPSTAHLYSTAQYSTVQCGAP